MEPIIELEKINYKYQPDDLRPALKDVSFTIDKGEWIAIIGHNGSGKSTLAKTINGLLLPESGVVKVGNQVLDEENIWTIRQMVGMVFQNPDNQFVGSTVEDDVAFGLENQGIPREEMLIRVKDALEKVRMAEFATREPARLSGGQKQRVAIAGVVALRPDIIILDEATSMLDPRGRKEINELVRELKKQNNMTIISITHDIEEAKNADRVILLNKGEIVDCDKPQKILTNEKLLKELKLDIPFSLKIARKLQKKGYQIKDTLDVEELEKQLCQLHAKV